MSRADIAHQTHERCNSLQLVVAENGESRSPRLLAILGVLACNHIRGTGQMWMHELPTNQMRRLTLNHNQKQESDNGV